MEVTKARRQRHQPRQSSNRPSLVPATRMQHSEAFLLGICYSCYLTQQKHACMECISSDKHQCTFTKAIFIQTDVLPCYVYRGETKPVWGDPDQAMEENKKQTIALQHLPFGGVLPLSSMFL